MGYTTQNRLADLLKYDLNQIVSNIETLRELDFLTKKSVQNAKIHLKVEIGTSRQGILIDNIGEYLELLKSNPKLTLAGLSTHYANIEDTTDHSFAEEQLQRFKAIDQIISSAGFTGYIRHTACSAAAILFDETYFDMVRVGIGLYGLWPSSETRVSAKQKGVEMDLRPVLTWKTRIAHIKELPEGSVVSYGCTEKLTARTKIAILPIGYFDGCDRGLSSIGNVLVHGKRCKILGRICMDMTVIDINNIPDVKLEDEVVLLGKQGSEIIGAEEIAKKINTINYEVVTRINPLIKRIIV